MTAILMHVNFSRHFNEVVFLSVKEREVSHLLDLEWHVYAFRLFCACIDEFSGVDIVQDLDRLLLLQAEKTASSLCM